MVKTKGPALSTTAAGTLAQTLTFNTTKTGPYAKKHAKPRNPKSPAQVGVRAIMKFLAQGWKPLSAVKQFTWTDRAASMNVYPYHAYVSENQTRWANFLGLTQEDNYTGAMSPPTAPTLRATAYIKQAEIRIGRPGSGGVWGWFLFRSQTNGFTPQPSNCVAVVPYTPPFYDYYWDTPLTTGTYYYRAQGFRVYGLQSLFSLQDSCTIA